MNFEPFHFSPAKMYILLNLKFIILKGHSVTRVKNSNKYFSMINELYYFASLIKNLHWNFLSKLWIFHYSEKHLLNKNK